MANIEFNTSNIKRVPINRNNLFYSEESFDFERTIGKDYTEQDMNQTAVLYSVDASATNIDDTYGETKENGVVFKTPVEFHCVYEIEEPELRSYDKTKSLGTYMKYGKLKLGVYQETLNELNIEIKKGDYLGIQVTEEKMLYFSVNYVNPNFHNAGTLFGVKPLYWEVYGIPVDQSEFTA